MSKLPNPGESFGMHLDSAGVLRNADDNFVTGNRTIKACWAFAAWTVKGLDRATTESGNIRECEDAADTCLAIAKGED